ncbi:MAG: UDP-N-acetylglucosamine--N-acetylmuramyl-(pentapeptide) pyrophosphoryl-undecaprenol N-acetylglucosamine transferase [Paraglaciecola sp.]|jgi:UDP-N-acetylglucosamine--N-acetylmuramyl-(pentapeptide) pyrophosphoryl-undecaprenol N-acetylglucosamine transferase
MNKTLLVMAGGTGGHVFPALAVADALTKLGWHIHWLGTKQRMEATIVPKAGYAISFIDIAGVRGNGARRLLSAPFKILKAVLQARKIIRQVKPDLVLGMGGFASGPGGVAAWMMGIPLILHEQNAVPGATNKILACIATKVMTGFERTFVAQRRLHTDTKYLWVGNPLRCEFNALLPKTRVHSPLQILVLGGSLGAKALNDEVPTSLAAFSGFTVRHQCGGGHLDSVTTHYQSQLQNGCSWQVVEFIDDMPSAYQWADLVICRSGALTVAEVAATGVAAIFVPLPYAVDDHQSKNALSLVNRGGAYLLKQTELREGELTTILQECFNQPQQLLAMGHMARKLAKLNAVQDVTHCCQTLVGKGQ